MSDKVLIPFAYKKYRLASGKEVIRLVMTKRDKPEYYRGSLKGKKIEKVILNTKEDAMKQSPIVKTYVEKPVIVKASGDDVKVVGEGLLSNIPIIGTIFDSLFGGADAGAKLKSGKLKVTKEQTLVMKKMLKRDLMNLMNKLGFPKKVKRNQVWILWKELVKQAKNLKQGGLLTTPFE